MPTFDSYQQLVAQIALDAGNISTWTLQMSVDSDFAAILAGRIAAQCGNVQERINGLFSGHHTNESVLEDCRSMLRTFETTLAKLESRI